MRAEPEGEMVVGLAGHVHAFGIDEVPRVAVGRGVHQHDLLTRPHGDVAHGDVARRGAAHVVDRRHVADEFLRRDRRVRAVLQELPLVGTVDEVQHRARDDCPGRLGAAVEDEEAVASHLLDRERPPLDL